MTAKQRNQHRHKPVPSSDCSCREWWPQDLPPGHPCGTCPLRGLCKSCCRSPDCHPAITPCLHIKTNMACPGIMHTWCQRRTQLQYLWKSQLCMLDVKDGHNCSYFNMHTHVTIIQLCMLCVKDGHNCSYFNTHTRHNYACFVSKMDITAATSIPIHLTIMHALCQRWT